MSRRDPTTELTQNLNGIAVAELPESMQFVIDRDGARGIRKFYCAWDDRNRLIRELYGKMEWVNGELKRKTVAESFPEFDFVKCRMVSYRGHGRQGTSGGIANFQLAEVTANYSVDEKEDEEKKEEDRVIASETIDFGTEFITMPEGGVKWTKYVWEQQTDGSFVRKEGNAGAQSESGKNVMQQVPLRITVLNHRLTKNDLLEIPKAQLSLTIGKLNNATFIGISPLRLFFSGATTSIRITSEGKIMRDMTMVLAERERPWHLLFNAKAQDWLETDPPIYQSADFTPLLKFTQIGGAA